MCLQHSNLTGSSRNGSCTRERERERERENGDSMTQREERGSKITFEQKMLQRTEGQT